jgi:hypothetical protein
MTYEPKNEHSRLVIVPLALHDAIEARLDAEQAADPGIAEEREALRSLLIALFDEHGYLPEFTIERNSAQ